MGKKFMEVIIDTFCRFAIYIVCTCSAYSPSVVCEHFVSHSGLRLSVGESLPRTLEIASIIPLHTKAESEYPITPILPMKQHFWDNIQICLPLVIKRQLLATCY